MTKNTSTPFFTRDPLFYKSFFKMMLVVAFQNLVAYSVNMLDNIMLGSYSQTALSGAATVNQIFFVVSQLAIAIGNSLVVMSSQYWGKKDTDKIRRATAIAVFYTAAASAIVFILCTVLNSRLLGIFTSDQEIIREGTIYLGILKWTFVFYLFSSLFIAMLRSVEIVRISFVISVISLIINGTINYTLIFGKFGFPEMGIRGAAIGTLVARTVELLIVIFYVAKADKKIRFFGKNPFADFKLKGSMTGEFLKISTPAVISKLAWSISTPVQTALLGYLSADAIAANSVATTFFQYLKVTVVAIASSSAVMIGKSIGEGNEEKVKAEARTLSVIDLCVGCLLGFLLFMFRGQLLSYYNLTEQAKIYADHFIIIMSLVMVTMSYQMPVSTGILEGGGDVKFHMYLNIISVWVIVIPLSFLAVFVWNLPAEWIVIIVQSDQIFKCLPIFIRFRSYKWIHKIS